MTSAGVTTVFGMDTAYDVPTNHTFNATTGVFTSNSVANNMDLGIFPLRLGGYAVNSSGASYAIANSHYLNTSTINNFIYYDEKVEVSLKYYAIFNPTFSAGGYNTGMVLSLPNTTFTNTSFTIEFYVFFDGVQTSSGGDAFVSFFGSTTTILEQSALNLGYWYKDKQLDARATGSANATSAIGGMDLSTTTNVWRHVAFVYTYNATASSCVIRCFVNGVNTLTLTGTPTQASINSITSLRFPGTSNAFKGRFRDVRISKSAVYPGTTTFTPATELTSLPTTDYLLKFTGSNIAFNAGVNQAITTTPTGTITYGTG